MGAIKGDTRSLDSSSCGNRRHGCNRRLSQLRKIGPYRKPDAGPSHGQGVYTVLWIGVTGFIRSTRLGG